MWINICIILFKLNLKKHPIMNQNLQEILNKTAEDVRGRNLLSGDLSLKKLLVFDFYTSLFEDEILQGEYRVEDIALIVLCFWNNENKEKQKQSEDRIRDVLYEPINESYFIHYAKILNYTEAYEFVLKAILHALENNFILRESLRDLHTKAHKVMNLCSQLPMGKRNHIGLSYTLGFVELTKDPAIEKFCVQMN